MLREKVLSSWEELKNQVFSKMDINKIVLESMTKKFQKDLETKETVIRNLKEIENNLANRNWKLKEEVKRLGGDPKF